MSDWAPQHGGDGLMIGRNRQGTPVILRMVRAEPTRVVFLGGLPCLHVILARAIALGVRVVVWTWRPGAWNGFVQALGVGPSIVVFAPVGSLPPPSGRAIRGDVVVVDVGRAAWKSLDTSAPWRTTLVVRSAVEPGDERLLAGADLVLAQPLAPEEASIVASAVGLTTAEAWLASISPALLTIISGRAARWAAVSPTSAEAHTFGALTRQ